MFNTKNNVFNRTVSESTGAEISANTYNLINRLSLMLGFLLTG